MNSTTKFILFFLVAFCLVTSSSRSTQNYEHRSQPSKAAEELSIPTKNYGLQVHIQAQTTNISQSKNSTAATSNLRKGRMYRRKRPLVKKRYEHIDYGRASNYSRSIGSHLSENIMTTQVDEHKIKISSKWNEFNVKNAGSGVKIIINPQIRHEIHLENVQIDPPSYVPERDSSTTENHMSNNYPDLIEKESAEKIPSNSGTLNYDDYLKYSSKKDEKILDVITFGNYEYKKSETVSENAKYTTKDYSSNAGTLNYDDYLKYSSRKDEIIYSVNTMYGEYTNENTSEKDHENTNYSNNAEIIGSAAISTMIVSNYTDGYVSEKMSLKPTTNLELTKPEENKIAEVHGISSTKQVFKTDPNNENIEPEITEEIASTKKYSSSAETFSDHKFISSVTEKYSSEEFSSDPTAYQGKDRENKTAGDSVEDLISSTKDPFQIEVDNENILTSLPLIFETLAEKTINKFDGSGDLGEFIETNSFGIGDDSDKLINAMSFRSGSDSDKSMKVKSFGESGVSDHFSSFLDIFSGRNVSKCRTPKGEPGHCRRFRDCLLSDALSTFNMFLKYLCAYRGTFIGICCPDNPVIEIIDSEDDNSTETFPHDIKQPPEGCGLNTKTRIVGGKISVPHEWTWMVALMKKNQFYCGAVVINNWYVLTAAHCVLGVNVREIKVRIGEHNFSSKTEHQEDIAVAEIKLHAQFVILTFQHDIALLRLKKMIEYTKFVGSVCLPTKSNDYANKNGTVLGWGLVTFGGSASPILREVTIPVWKNEECDKIYALEIIGDSFLCAGSPDNGEDACQGDSGGPLMVLNENNRWEIIGIVSWGRRCGDPTYPGVYTRVTTYLDWIKENAH